MSFRITSNPGVGDSTADVKLPGRVGFNEDHPPPSPPRAPTWANRVVSPSVRQPGAGKGVSDSLVPSSFGVDDSLLLGDPPGCQLPPWTEFRVKLKTLLDGLVPKKLWWYSTPGWWTTSSGPERMKKFLVRRLTTVEGLGKRPVSLLLSLLSLLGFDISRRP